MVLPQDPSTNPTSNVLKAADSKGLVANADGDVAESVEEHLDGWSESDSLQPLV